MGKSTTKNKAPRRFASYARCSTDDQAQGDFTTIDVQHSFNAAHADKLGGSIVARFEDDGFTGSNLKRPDWKRMLQCAEHGDFDGVIVTYMSRLGRGSAFDIAEYELDKYNVTVEMVKEKYTDDLQGYMGKSFQKLMDGAYPVMVSGWTRTKMEAMVEAGYFCGGYTPFGYQLADVASPKLSVKPGKPPPKHLVIDKQTAHFVRSAFYMAAGGESLSSIARYLNAATDREWSTTNVKHMIHNETYKGMQIFGKWRNDEAHPAIVNDGEWEKAQTIKPMRDTSPARFDADEFTYYLRGLVFCPHCGCAYTQASATGRTGKSHYYVCQSTNRGLSCPVGRVNAERLHDALLTSVRHAAAHPAVMGAIVADCAKAWRVEPKVFEERGPLGKRRQLLNMQIGNYTKAIGEGRAIEPLLKALEKAEAGLAEVTQRIEFIDAEIVRSKVVRPSAAQIAGSWQMFLDQWETIPDDLKALACQAFVRKVLIQEKELAEFELETNPPPASSSESDDPCSMVRVEPSTGSGGWT